MILHNMAGISAMTNCYGMLCLRLHWNFGASGPYCLYAFEGSWHVHGKPFTYPNVIVGTVSARMLPNGRRWRASLQLTLGLFLLIGWHEPLLWSASVILHALEQWGSLQLQRYEQSPSRETPPDQNKWEILNFPIHAPKATMWNLLAWKHLLFRVVHGARTRRYENRKQEEINAELKQWHLSW